MSTKKYVYAYVYMYLCLYSLFFNLLLLTFPSLLAVVVVPEQGGCQRRGGWQRGGHKERVVDNTEGDKIGNDTDSEGDKSSASEQLCLSSAASSCVVFFGFFCEGRAIRRLNGNKTPVT